MSIISDIQIGNRYLEWNNRLARHFFNEEAAGKEVLLFVTRKTIDELGNDLGGFEDFLACVKVGPPWVTRQGICQKALQSYEEWRSRDTEFPPYIAYLTLFVLAGDIEGDFSVHSYYPRLWNLLSEAENTRPLPSFDEMWQLWVDLEKWSREDKSEELGRFTFRIRGGMVHVGIPLSQTLLSIEERKKLSTIFAKADLDPTNTPSSVTLVEALSEVAATHHLLFPRTLRLLQSNSAENQPLKEALLEVIAEELSQWDGIERGEDSGEEETLLSTRTGLRICLQIDNLAKKVLPYLRFKSNREIPDNGLNFSFPQKSTTLTCRESNSGWSTQLLDSVSGKVFDASTISWTERIVLIDDEYKWRALFKASPVRLFASGRNFGLKDWVESQKIERVGKYIVVCSGQLREQVKSWAAESCEEFLEQNYSGLPVGWSLFEIRNPRNSCDGIEVLQLSSDVRIKLEGGVRIGPGNKFLSLALPSIVLENITGQEQAFLNDQELTRSDANPPAWRLPPELQIDTPLKITVKQNGVDKHLSRTIRILEPEISVAFEPIRRDLYGNIVETNDATPYLSGVELYGVHTEAFGEIPVTLPTYLSNRIFFVGSVPGQIFEWPKDKIPDEWTPVWAIAKKGRKEWTVHLCGKLNGLSVENQTSGSIDLPAVRKWREVIWNNRKINTPPALPLLKLQWKNFVERAKDA
jgi:hypothetical protein